MTFLPDDLPQHSFPNPTIKPAIENLFPGPEVQLTDCNCHDNLAAHHLSLEVSVSVIFSGFIVVIATDGFVWCELFKPGFIIVMKPTFVIVNENRGGYIHSLF